MEEGERKMEPQESASPEVAAARRIEAGKLKATAELLSTEVTFVNEIQVLVEVFVKPLKIWAADLEAAAEAQEADDSPEDRIPAITLADVGQIFSNVEQLLGFNKQFLNDLKEANEQGAEEMLEVFLKAAPFFKMYSLYINNFDRARNRLASLEARSFALTAFIAACEAQRACHGLRLRDFLIQPVQRIPRYRLLLETMLKYTPEEDPTHAALGKALASMSMTADKINADVHLMEKRAKVLELQDEFGAAFVQASRLFVRDGMLLKICRNGPRQYRFLLFNDLLVYGEERGVFRGMLGNSEKRYKAKRAISLDACFVVDSPTYGRKEGSPMGEAGFMIVSASKSFIVQVPTAAEKDSWVQSLRMCMDELVQKEKQRRKQAGDEGAPPHHQGRRNSSGGSWGGQDHNFTVWVVNKEGKPARQGYSLPPAARQKRCGCVNFNELSMRRISESGPSVGGANGMAASLTQAAAGFGASASSVFSSVGGRTSLEGRASLSRRNAPVTGYLGSSSFDGANSRDDSDYGEMSPRSVLNIAAMMVAQGVGAKKRPVVQQVTVRVDLAPGGALGLRLKDMADGTGVVVVGYSLAAAAAAAAVGSTAVLGPAAAAGVEAGDRIVSVGGSTIASCEQLQYALRNLQTSVANGGLKRNASGATAVVLGLLRGFETVAATRDRSAGGSIGSVGGSSHGTAPWLVPSQGGDIEGPLRFETAAAEAAATAAARAAVKIAASEPAEVGLTPPPVLTRLQGASSDPGVTMSNGEDKGANNGVPPPVPQRQSLPARTNAAAWTPNALPPPVPPFVDVGTTPESSPIGTQTSRPPKPPLRGSSVEETRRLSMRKGGA